MIVLCRSMDWLPRRLRDLERENATLKRLPADAELEKGACREIAKGNL